jgi:hypothetical protein
MDDLVKSFALALVDLLDIAFHAPLWALLAWAVAAAMTAVLISTLLSSSGQRGKALFYIALGLIIYVEILRPVGWIVFFG